MYSENTGKDLTTMAVDPLSGLTYDDALKLPEIKANGTPTRMEVGEAFEGVGGIKNIDYSIKG